MIDRLHNTNRPVGGVHNRIDLGQFSFFIILALFTYFVLSGFTQVDRSIVGQGILGRLIKGDIFMFFLAIFGLGFIRKIYFPIEYASYLLFILISGFAGLFAFTPRQASIELLVHIWAWIGSLMVFNILAKDPERGAVLALHLILYSTTVLAILGFLHFFFFPQMFDVPVHGGVVGTFRNGGQSGSYMGMIIAIMIPAMLSGMVKPTRIHTIMVGVLVASLIFATKRAAMVGLAIGYIGLLFLLLSYGGTKAKKIALQLLLLTLIIAPILWLGLEWGKENIDKMAYRLKHKLGEGALEKFSNNFFDDNIGSAMEAFYDKPIIGVGMGNVAGTYTAKYEIHSTYFKIMATGGLLGMLSYGLFLGVWIFTILKNAGTYCRQSLFLLYFSPFMIGLIVSWIYTYHLRKREFWICFAITVLIATLAKIKKRHII